VMPHTLETPARRHNPMLSADEALDQRPAWEPEPIEHEPSRVPSAGDYRPFDNVESRNGLQERIELPLLLRMLRLPRHARVLEVGCGRGVALPVLAERLEPVDLVGVDVDARLIEHARERIARRRVAASVHVGDVRDLPFASGRFDVVIDFGTCYHVSGGVTGKLAALNEISRVLRVGGLFVHETRFAQRLAHPVRSLRRKLPWTAVPMLAAEQNAVLWATRRRVGPVLV
jgi:SAM-dependent methyltransferase